MIISDRVRERMRVCDISETALARHVGMTQGAIAKIANYNPNGSSKLHLIARALRTTPAFLTGETDDPDKDAPSQPELTYDERQVLDCYRRLGPAQRSAWLTLAMTMVGEALPGSVHSPASTYSAQQA